MSAPDYGHFRPDGREYVVTVVDTPLPFVNYFWNARFISGVSQHMAGIGCFTERPMQYMHPERRCLLVRDENRHFYLRDDETGEIWSPGWYPVLKDLDRFQCRHGLGYSVLDSAFGGISVRLRVFVPTEDPVEVWHIALTNETPDQRVLRLYSFVDWLLKGYDEYADYHSSLRSAYLPDDHLLVCFNETSERTHDFYNGFIASDQAPCGFDSSRRAFLGYAQVNRPRAVAEGQCRNSLGVCEKLVGVLEHALPLLPGEKKELCLAIGATDSAETARAVCHRLFQPGEAEREFLRVTRSLAEGYGRVAISTPEAKIDHLFNHWIKRAVQLHTEVGTDTGRGFRDVLQAAWAVASFDPDGARRKIVDCLRHQFSDGHTLRGWNPPDPHHYSDGPVWIAPAVDAYLKETRDFAFLDTRVPFYDAGEATVWEHTVTAIRHATEDLGPHGLIRAHYGDWNDSLNMMGVQGRGESVWTTIAMVFGINAAVEIARHARHDQRIAVEFEERAERLKRAIDRQGWDGRWYLEGYNDAGDKIGSHAEREGRIYLNPQTWAILAGVADGRRLPDVLRVIDHDLECDYGSLVLTPAYRSPKPGIGRLSWFVPGMWENASAYCHGTSFKIVADTYLKRGNEAYRSLMKVLPDSGLNPSAHSGCPPYMVTNMYYGPEHPRRGQILYSWITGTADWLFKAMTNQIIGVRATYDGLLIDPCVPAHWERFGLRRAYLGAEYEVEFQNPGRKQSGLTSLVVDGQAVEGNLVPAFEDGRLHRVRVVM